MLDARVVILDEPTSALAPQEVDALLADDRPAAQRRARPRAHHPQAAARPGRSPTASPCCAGAAASWSGASPADHTDEELITQMVGAVPPPLPAERSPPRTEPALRVERPDGARRRRHAPAARTPPSTSGPASWSASPASRATASASSSTPSSASSPLADGWIHVGDQPIDRARPTLALRAGATTVPEDPVSDAVVVGPRRPRAPRPRRRRHPHHAASRVDWRAVRDRVGGNDIGAPPQPGLARPAGRLAVGRQHPAGPAHPVLPGRHPDPRRRRLPQPGPRHRLGAGHPGAAPRATGGRRRRADGLRGPRRAAVRGRPHRRAPRRRGRRRSSTPARPTARRSAA